MSEQPPTDFAAPGPRGARPGPRPDAPLLPGGDALFRHLVESARDYAIFMLTPAGLIASWNAGAERIKGYSAGEIIGQHFSIFYTPDALAKDWPQEELRQAAQHGRLEDEGWRVRKDGRQFWANVVISALRDDAGGLLGFSKVTRDLTERRRQEERLREREENLRLLVEGVRDHAMLLLDAQGRIQTWNIGARRLLGHDTDNVLLQHWSLLYLEEERLAQQPQADLQAAELAGSIQVQGWRCKADAQRFWAEASITTLRTPSGQVRGFVLIVRDLTEQRRVQTLESESQRLAEFIAMLSHELRNPLAPIKNAMSVLGRSPDRAQANWCIDVVGRQVTHLTRLVDDLLDVSRVTIGKIRLEAAALEMNTLVRIAVETVREAVAARGHTLNLVLVAEPVPVVGDSTRLTQVVLNLLNNAIKYTPAGGCIDVSLLTDGRQATLRVRDNGIGMAAELLTRAFDPFVQGARGLERSEGGMGIGLTLVQRIVELHGGRVQAHSAGVGQGAAFEVQLPISRVQADAPAASEAPRPGAVAKVLVVDDNVDAAESLGALLRLYGHEVQIAYDGPQALSFAAPFVPDVVLLDIGLPGMDGYRVARLLRAVPGMASSQLVALTGYGQESDRRTAADAGFDAHLTKPVDPDSLMRLIAAPGPWR